VRKLIVTLSLFFLSTTALADTYHVKKKYYTSKGIEVEDVVIPNTTVFEYKGKSGYDVKNQGCSAIASLYSQLALEKNLDAIKNVFDNWKSIALPLTIYAIATQFPIVKEALVSSQFMSDFLASLGGTSCEEAMQFINRMNGISKEAVTECMKKWSDTCNKSSDPNKCFLEHCGVHKSWYEMITGKTFSDLLKDNEALKKVSQVLAMVNPKTAVECAVGVHVSTSMTKEQFEEQVAKLEEDGMNEVQAKTLLFLMSTIPQVKISSNGMGLDIPKIDGKVVTITSGLKMLQEDLLNDLDNLLSYIETAKNRDEIKEKVKEFAAKYGIEIDLDNYFVLMQKVKEKLQEDCPTTLSGSEVIPEKEAKNACLVRVQAFEQAKENFVKLLSYLYAERIKDAVLRYIDQTKLYLLQNKGKGVAACGKLSGTKIDFSPDSVKFMISQLDTIKDQVKTEIDDYLKASGINDVSEEELSIVRLLAKAVDGKDHAKGERIEFKL